MSVIKLCFKNIKEPLQDAISQQIDDMDEFLITENEAEANIFLISDDVDIRLSETMPKIIIESDKKYRLAELLNKIVQTAKHPLQYLQDINIGTISFRPQQKLIIRDDNEIALTDREIDILYYLIKHKGEEISKDQMLRDVWKYQEGIDTHTLETHIYRLRQKIELNADNPDFLLTKENGYILNV